MLNVLRTPAAVASIAVACTTAIAAIALAGSVNRVQGEEPTGIEVQRVTPRAFAAPPGRTAATATADTGVRVFAPKIPIGEDRLRELKEQGGAAAGAARKRSGAAAGDTVPPLVLPAPLTVCETNPATGFAPSDIHGAAGPTNLVVVTNVDIGVYARADCSVVNFVSLRDFFGVVTVGEILFDPRTVFDPLSGRFIVTAESLNTGNDDQYQYFGVSTDSNGTAWNTYQVVLSEGAAHFCKQAVDSFWDYPSAGYSDSRWFITANDFGSKVRGALLSVDKTPTLTGDPAMVRCFNKLAFNLAPPLVLDGNPLAYFLSPGSGQGKKIARYQLTPGATPALDVLKKHGAAKVTPWIISPDAPQPNGFRLDVIDGRFQSASPQIGMSLWNVHTVSDVGFASIRLYKLSTDKKGKLPLFTGTFFTTGTDFVFNPSVATASDASGSVAFLTATRTIPSGGAAGRAAMVMFAGPNDSAAGWDFVVVATSTVSVSTDCQFGTICRWGDYSSTQIDPIDPGRAWGFNQLAAGNSQFDWDTRGALIAP